MLIIGIVILAALSGAMWYVLRDTSAFGNRAQRRAIKAKIAELHK